MSISKTNNQNVDLSKPNFCQKLTFDQVKKTKFGQFFPLENEKCRSQNPIIKILTLKNQNFIKNLTFDL